MDLTTADDGQDNSPDSKSFFQLLQRGEAGILNGFFFALSVGLITSGLVMVIWCLLSIEPASVRDRFYNESHRISVNGDALIWISAMTGCVFFIYLLLALIRKSLNTQKQTKQDSQDHSAGYQNFQSISRFEQFMSSSILPGLSIISLVIIIATGLLAASVEETFNLGGGSEYLMMGILFLGSSALVLVWMFGFRQISQQTKTIASTSGSPETSAENALSEVGDGEKNDGLGLWARAIKPFIKNSSGLLILLMTALAPISIATYFLLNPKDGNINEFGLIQIWALPVGGFVGWLFLYPLSERTRWMRTFAKICLGLILFISGGTGLFVSIENYRGERAWSNFKEEWEAKGISFDKKSYIPAQIPKEKNFSFTPLLKPLRSQDVGLARSGRLKEIADAGGHFYLPENQPDKLMVKGLVINLSHKQDYFRSTKWKGWPIAPDPQTPAKDVLLALSHFETDFEQLKEDSINRPLANYGGLNTDSQPIHHSPIADLCNFLILRARAHLQDDQPDAAIEDVQLLYYLAGTIGAEPLLDSLSVHTKICMAGRVPIWEGLVLDQWKPVHLAKIQAILEKHDLLKTVKPAILGSTFWQSLPDFESLIGPHDQLEGFLRDVYRFEHIQLKPRGWVRQNQVTLCRLVLEQILPQFDPEAHRFYLSKEYVPIQVSEPSKPYRFLLKNTELWVLPALKIPENQIKLDLMIIACSLEHYRLTNGNYPQSLDAIKRLDGKELPHEVFTGKPYAYKRLGQEQGAYTLHSVGPDLKDDRGDAKLDIVWIPKGEIAPAKN